MKTIAIEDSLGLTVCNKQQIAVERGLGSYVWDEGGHRYLDFTSGWGVTALGHSHPVIVAAISTQAAKLMQNPNSGFTYSPVRSRLLAKLQSVLPNGLHRVFFANSGAEANDGAVKLARKVTGRPTVIAVSGSFHGRTLSTLSLSGGPENSAHYLPAVPGNVFAPFGDVEALGALMNEQVAAVIAEPVQGEGGVQIPPQGYLQALSGLCREHGALFIADEVQTGFCRTGSFFAANGIQMRTDAQVAALTAVCLEKGLIVTPTRNGVLRLIPSLLVSAQEIDEAMGLLHSALSQLQSEYGHLPLAKSASL